jgi:hypothetical protein
MARWRSAKDAVRASHNKLIGIHVGQLFNKSNRLAILHSVQNEAKRNIYAFPYFARSPVGL